MRIGIDVRYLSHGLVGGVHTFMRNFITALLETGKGHEFILYADTKKPFELPDLPTNASLRLLTWRTPLSSVVNDVRLGRAMATDKVEVAHFAGNYGFAPASCRTIVTLQDEINLLPLSEIWRGHAKNPRTLAMMTYLHYCTRAAVSKADTIITISEYSKRQIARYGGVDPERIVPIHHGCPVDIGRVSDPTALTEVRRRLGLTKPIVLAEAFKNPGVIVRAWKRLPPEIRDGHEIVFFSRSQDVLPVVGEAVEAGWARLLVRPRRTDLAALYTMARAFLFPSWIEGFGIPLVEAMTCGAPIICSDRGAIPEVVADSGIVLDAEDDAALAHHLAALLTDPVLRETLRDRGFARAAHFTWRENARRVLDVYSHAH